RDGWHSADRALRLHAAGGGGPEARGLPVGAHPHRQLHHVPGDGRALDHTPSTQRRAAPSLGRTRPHTGAAMGRVILDASLARSWLDRFGEAVTANAAELTRLDAAIGDADHGTNMDRGLRAVRE